MVFVVLFLLVLLGGHFVSNFTIYRVYVELLRSNYVCISLKTITVITEIQFSD